jgi:hypothetical protein
MKEKEKSQILKSSEKNIWRSKSLDLIVGFMRDCEHRPSITPHEDPDTGIKIITDDDLAFIRGVLSMMEGFKQDDRITQEAVKELRLLNENITENIGYLDEIIETEKMSQVAKDINRQIRHQLSDFTERYDFTDTRIVGGKFVSIKKLETKEAAYCVDVLKYLAGCFLKEFYKLEPKDEPHA